MANTKIKIEDLKDLKLFKKWFEEIEKKAIDEKKLKAEEKYGDKDKWQKEIWKSADKNIAIKKKFKDELKRLNPHPKNKDGYEYEIRPNDDKNVRKYHKGGWLYDFCLRELEILDDKTQNSKKTKKPKKIITLKK